nr:MAG TPA: hypothetical protein [Crassvirales sp.]
MQYSYYLSFLHSATNILSIVNYLTINYYYLNNIRYLEKSKYTIHFVYYYRI